MVRTYTSRYNRSLQELPERFGSGPSNTGRKTPLNFPPEQGKYNSYPIGSVWGTCSNGVSPHREVVILHVSAGYGDYDGCVTFEYLPNLGYPSREVRSWSCTQFSLMYFFERGAL